MVEFTVTAQRGPNMEVRSFEWTGLGKSGVPKWMGSTFRDAEDVIYLSAGFAMALGHEEQWVFEDAVANGVRGIVDRGHAYLPVRWLALRYPQLGELLEV